MVTNLHYELNPKDLISVFGQVGTLVREPLIRYDRSGRSSGVAIINYELPDEAARAITQYNGATANGQMMTVEYDKAPPPGPRPRRRVASAPASLINRIQKPPLLERLGNSKTSAPPNPTYVCQPVHCYFLLVTPFDSVAARLMGWDQYERSLHEQPDLARRSQRRQRN